MNEDLEHNKAFIREKIREGAEKAKVISDEISYQRYRIGNVLALVAGVIFLAVGAYLFWRDYASAAIREKVTGTVSGFEKSITNNGKSSTTGKTSEVSKLVITYNYKGETKTIVGNTASGSNVQSLKEGDAVVLLIDPQNPNDIIIDLFMERYLIMLGCAGLGAVFLVIGVRKVFF